ncbi:MAG: hypothetical protein JWN37_375 [Candidatus Nomurabacteria bacterium]|nr:hypothetical protein [Candidatus Nomurabacteria bacterium]
MKFGLENDYIPKNPEDFSVTSQILSTFQRLDKDIKKFVVSNPPDPLTKNWLFNKEVKDISDELVVVIKIISSPLVVERVYLNEEEIKLIKKFVNKVESWAIAIIMHSDSPVLSNSDELIDLAEKTTEFTEELKRLLIKSGEDFDKYSIK